MQLIAREAIMTQQESVSSLSKTLNLMPNLVIILTGEIDKLTNQVEIHGAHLNLATIKLPAKSSEKLGIGRTALIRPRKKELNSSTSTSTVISKLQLSQETLQLPLKPMPPTAWLSSPKTILPTKCSLFKSSWNASTRKFNLYARHCSISIVC